MPGQADASPIVMPSAKDTTGLGYSAIIAFSAYSARKNSAV